MVYMTKTLLAQSEPANSTFKMQKHIYDASCFFNTPVVKGAHTLVRDGGDAIMHFSQTVVTHPSNAAETTVTAHCDPFNNPSAPDPFLSVFCKLICQNCGTATQRWQNLEPRSIPSCPLFDCLHTHLSAHRAQDLIPKLHSLHFSV